MNRPYFNGLSGYFGPSQSGFAGLRLCGQALQPLSIPQAVRTVDGLIPIQPSSGRGVRLMPMHVSTGNTQVFPAVPPPVLTPVQHHLQRVGCGIGLSTQVASAAAFARPVNALPTPEVKTLAPLVQL